MNLRQYMLPALPLLEYLDEKYIPYAPPVGHAANPITIGPVPTSTWTEMLYPQVKHICEQYEGYRVTISKCGPDKWEVSFRRYNKLPPTRKALNRRKHQRR